MKLTSFDEFKELATRGTFVPVCKEIIADLLTPVSAFLKIAEHSDYAFLLESVEGGEHVGRYSFLGKDPLLVVRSREDGTVIERAGQTEHATEGFMPTVRRLMADFRAPYVPDLPRFTGGAVGYIAYDAARWFEPVPTGDRPLEGPAAAADLAVFMLFDTVLAFDHAQHRLLLIANARITADDDLEALYQFACARIQFLEAELERSLSAARAGTGAPVVLRANMTKQAFEDNVRTAKEHIAAGDIYQVVLSQRFEADVTADPFTVYRALRHVNPSPYMYFMRIGGLAVVGSSPEMLVRVEGRHIETHPIAGTRPRGRTTEEDQRLAEELKRNEKERAEHVMLVDLGRNDVGRVAEYRVRPGADLHDARALLARHAPRLGRRGPARRRHGSPRRPRLVLSGGHRVGRPEGARDADHRRARADPPRDLRGRRGLSRLCRQPGLLHHHSHGRHDGRQGVPPGGRRHRRRLQPRGGVRGNPRQGPRRGARPGAGAAGLLN